MRIRRQRPQVLGDVAKRKTPQIAREMLMQAVLVKSVRTHIPNKRLIVGMREGIGKIVHQQAERIAIAQGANFSLLQARDELLDMPRRIDGVMPAHRVTSPKAAQIGCREIVGAHTSKHECVSVTCIPPNAALTGISKQIMRQRTVISLLHCFPPPFFSDTIILIPKSLFQKQNRTKRHCQFFQDRGNGILIGRRGLTSDKTYGKI